MAKPTKKRQKRRKKVTPDPRPTRSDTLGRPPKPPVGPLGERIDALVKVHFKGNRSALAHKAGLVPSRLSETIRGLSTPTMATLERIASACDISLSDLLDTETDIASEAEPAA